MKQQPHSYAVTVSAECATELAAVRASDRARIRDALTQLQEHAETETSHRKRLDLSRLTAPIPFPYQPPVWQLAVGSWRVFYDVEDRLVIVRAIRFKTAHLTTEDIL